MALKLLVAASNGNGSSKQLVFPEQGNVNKRYSYTVYIYGTFNSATVKLQGSPDDSNWFDIPNASWTAKATTNVEFYGIYLRGVVTGGSSPSIDLRIV